MRTKAILVLLFLLIGSLLIFGLWALVPSQQNGGDASDPYQSAEGGAGPDVSGDVAYYWHILDTLRAEHGTYDTEILEQLAEQVNVLGYEANVLLAQNKVAQGDDALSYFRRALEIYDARDIRWQLAAYLSEKGLAEEAAAEYIRLLPDEEALAALAGLARPEQIAAALTEGRHWWSAADFLEPLADNTDDGTDTMLLKLYARALVETGQFKEALDFLQPLTEKLTNRELSWLYARSLEAAGEVKKAAQLYSTLGEAGAYRLAMLLEKEGITAEAAHSFGRSTLPAARWRGARLWDELGEKEKALELYLGLARAPGSYQDDAAYRTYILLAGEGPRAAEMLEVLAAHPAWMKRLGGEPVWHFEPDPEFDQPDFLQRTETLRAAGLDYAANIELTIGTNNAGMADKLALAQWYLAQDQYYLAVRWGSSALAELPSRRAYDLAYPRPFMEAVLREAEAFSLDPNLVWAVMREESHFRPAVASRAGAMGLMQIMPATGKGIAASLKVEFAEKDLLDPEINIRFGAFYLRNMLNMFDGDLDKALAAYNGGGGNVRRWSAGGTGSTAAGFPTAIPFFETRQYITKVRNSYYTYQRLYGH